MGSRAEHRAIAKQAAEVALKAAARGDERTYQREKRVTLAHETQAKDEAHK
jgi:hypothetical protein